MLAENDALFIEALRRDLGRPDFEAVGLELVPLNVEIDHGTIICFIITANRCLNSFRQLLEILESG